MDVKGEGEVEAGGRRSGLVSGKRDLAEILSRVIEDVNFRLSQTLFNGLPD